MTVHHPQKYRGAPVIERFMAKVVKNANELGCWEWRASTDGKGYGIFALSKPRRRVVRAHIWSYEHHVGLVPDGLQLDHLCDNKPCVNPEHLEPVTQAENLRRKFLSRTHCRNGHPYIDVRIDIDPETGWRHRYCRACKREWGRSNR